MPGTAGASALEVYEALRRRRRRLRYSLAMVVAAPLAVAMLLVAAAGEWRVPAIGLGAGVAALCALGLAGLAVARPFVGRAGAGAGRSAGADIDRWRRAALAEERTAGFLDALPPRRWAVWHDLRVPGSRANIDHVVVGPTGVWVVDTKSTRGRVRLGWRRVSLGGRRLDTAPLEWEAAVVSGRLGVTARPIVVVDAPVMRRRPGSCAGIPVVRADRLVPALRRGGARLGRSDVEMLSRRLEGLLGGPGKVLGHG